MEKVTDTAELGGKFYPVTAYVETKAGNIPIIDIKLMSDYEWQCNCLISRVEKPHLYKDEDIKKSIDELCGYIEKNIEKLEEVKPETKEYIRFFLAKRKQEQSAVAPTAGDNGSDKHHITKQKGK